MHGPIKFSKNTIHNINLYFNGDKAESKTEGSLVKLTPSQKSALQSICREQGISESKFIREAIDIYIERFPYRDKLKRHKRLLKELLDSLP